MNIRSNDFVLEIGSGHNPNIRSDVLCDKFIDDDEQRGGKIVTDRPIVEADGQFLPFADNSFDYVICLHVLEHVEDPEYLLSEMMRVSTRGYIETPSEVGELIYGWPYHNWIVNEVDGKLVIRENEKRAEFGQLFHTLAAKDKYWRKFHIMHHRLFLVQYEWENRIDYEILDQPKSPLNLKCPHTIEELLSSPHKNKNNDQLLLTLKSLVPREFVSPIKSFMSKRRRRQRIALKEILVCPKCKDVIVWQENQIHCQNCDRDYPIIDGIPRLAITPEYRRM